MPNSMPQALTYQWPRRQHPRALGYGRSPAVCKSAAFGKVGRNFRDPFPIGCMVPRCDHQAVAASAGVARAAGNLCREFVNVAPGWAGAAGAGRVSWQRWPCATWRLPLHAGGVPVLCKLVVHDDGSSGFERLVPVSCADCSASTSGLSTWWSSTALDETWF